MKTSLLEYLLTTLQTSRPETSLKRDSSTGIFLWIFFNFSKNLIYRKPPDHCSCWFLCSNQSFTHWSHFVCFFPSFFFLYHWQLQLCEFIQKVSKNEDFFTFYNSLLLFTSMLLRQVCLSNDLLTHIKENTDFLQQKPQQLPSIKANFKGWSHAKYQWITNKKIS